MEETMLALHLICAGGGQHISQTEATAVRGNDYENPVTITGTARSDYGDEVAVELNGKVGRIRVPDGMKPRLRTGGDDGWWKLKGIRVTPDEIMAKVALNPLNQPSVRIDRRTGLISIQGKSGNFSGYCRAYDPSTAPRRF